MPRSKNAGQRREVLAALRQVAKRIDWLKGQWTVATTVYVEPADRKPGDNLYLRDRQTDEYPENQLQAWTDLYNQADSAINELTALRETAYTRYKEILHPDGTADGTR